MFAWFIPIIGLPVQIIGLVLGGLSLKSKDNVQATVGIALCIVGIALSIINGYWGAYVATHPLTPEQACQRDVGVTSHYLGYEKTDGKYACSNP